MLCGSKKRKTLSGDMEVDPKALIEDAGNLHSAMVNLEACQPGFAKFAPPTAWKNLRMPCIQWLETQCSSVLYSSIFQLLPQWA